MVMTDAIAEEQDSPLSGVITAAELSHKEFPELVQHVFGIIIEGFGIVAGPPKLGKSFFTLVIALAVSAGGYAFGKVKCAPRPVLLLALEDSERRLQTRIRALYGSDIPPHNLHILTRIQPGLLIPTITAWLEYHPTGLVILDTLGRARQQRNRGDDAYLADYQAGVALKNIVDAFPGSVIARCAPHRGKPPVTTSLTTSRAHSVWPQAPTIYWCYGGRVNPPKPLSRSPAATHPKASTPSPSTAGDGSSPENGLLKLPRLRLTAATKANSVTVHKMCLRVVNDTHAVEGLLTCAGDVVARVGISQAQARVYLNRLADADRITKTGKGVYSSVTPVASVTPPGKQQVMGDCDDDDCCDSVTQCYACSTRVDQRQQRRRNRHNARNTQSAAAGHRRENRTPGRRTLA